MKHIKTLEQLNEASENLNISDVTNSKLTITGEELISFLKMWDSQEFKKFDTDWCEKSIKIANFLDLDKDELPNWILEGEDFSHQVG